MPPTFRILFFLKLKPVQTIACLKPICHAYHSFFKVFLLEWCQEKFTSMTDSSDLVIM